MRFKRSYTYFDSGERSKGHILSVWIIVFVSDILVVIEYEVIEKATKGQIGF